jgi:hypothetical protein
MSEPPQPPDSLGDQGPPLDSPPTAPQQPPTYPTPAPAYPYGGYQPPPHPGYPPQQWAPPQPGLPPFSGYAVPDLPKATAALVVGIVAVAGAFTCVLPILAAPVAWVLGAQARREIRNAPRQWGGEGRATAGMVLGIIGTVLLVLAIVLVVVLVVVAVNDSTVFDDNTGV